MYNLASTALDEANLISTVGISTESFLRYTSKRSANSHKKLILVEFHNK
ncbi:hypothetical protein VCHA54O485_60022 [Vibrio chagasii]|nr:hypothetical protein VCHA55P509_190022 [Vibrio chagasii]CAH7331437.1 hypothetical protein VCHA54O485_60022 [Vibrio chagasii]